MNRILPALLIPLLAAWAGCSCSHTATGPEGEQTTASQRSDDTAPPEQGAEPLEMTFKGEGGQEVRFSADEGGFTVVGPEGETVTTVTRDDGIEISVDGEESRRLQIADNEEGVDLPDDFPDDVPIYPGAIAIHAMSMPDSFIITLVTPDPAPGVIDSYRQSLEDSGWEVGDAITSPVTSTFRAAKDQRYLNVTIGRDEQEDRTIISLDLQKGTQ
jgi:hypothetical protein